MNTKNDDLNKIKPSATQIFPADTFSLAYSICARDGAEVIFEFSGRYDIPLGMRREHLHSTSIANELFFEHAIEIPARVALRKVIMDRCERARKQPPLGLSPEQDEALVPGTFSGVPPKDSFEESWNE